MINPHLLIIRWVQRKRERAGQSGKKRKFTRGKRERDWLLRRTSILPFWWSPSYTPPMKDSLKGWSRSRRSGVWWSRSFEKIGTSGITGCHLGNLVSLTDHCGLFFVFEVDIMSHLINETPCGPYHPHGIQNCIQSLSCCKNPLQQLSWWLSG